MYTLSINNDTMIINVTLYYFYYSFSDVAVNSEKNLTLEGVDKANKSAAVQEATNSHNFEMKNNIYERWTSLEEARDWTQYE